MIDASAPVLSGNSAIALQQVADWHAEQAQLATDDDLEWHIACCRALRKAADNLHTMTVTLRESMGT